MLDPVSGNKINTGLGGVKKQQPNIVQTSSQEIGNILNGGKKWNITPEKLSEIKQQVTGNAAKFEEALEKLSPELREARADLQAKVNSRSCTPEDKIKAAAWNKEHPDCPITTTDLPDKQPNKISLSYPFSTQKEE